MYDVQSGPVIVARLMRSAEAMAGGGGRLMVRLRLTGDVEAGARAARSGAPPRSQDVGCLCQSSPIATARCSFPSNRKTTEEGRNTRVRDELDAAAKSCMAPLRVPEGPRVVQVCRLSSAPFAMVKARAM